MAQLIDLGKLRFNFSGAWAAATTYEINDVVKYGGNVYCYTYGLATAGNHPGTVTTYWTLMVEGLNFTGAYDYGGTAYRVGDGVAHGGVVYICIQNNFQVTPPNAAYWSTFVDGMQWEGAYNAATAYQKNDIVLYGGGQYIAKLDTTGNAPSNATYWDLFQSGKNLRGTWTTATTYYPDDVVKHGGSTYYALLENTATTFEADLAASKWAIYASGVRWRSDWASGVAYQRDDVVGDGVSARICLIDHTSGVLVTDVAAGKWEYFVRGADDVLPVVGTNDTGKSLTIGNDGLTYELRGATESAKTFYVGPHGVDGVKFGRTIATPYASIKYATTQCGTDATIHVLTGTYSEQLPITVPDTVAIIGENQRTVLVQPAAGNSDNAAIPNNQSNMFLLSNGSILNKMTFKGLTGWVPGSTAADITTSTPKGVVVCLNPASPVTTKSPYVLECSAIGSGMIGAYVDGNSQSSGNTSMLFHGYTVISDNGVGYWMANGGKAEIVSCFTYYCYFGYATTHGGQIRALNGNNSYGTYGVVSAGFDDDETPIVGAIKGQRLNVISLTGTLTVGTVITGTTSGATATITNVQEAADLILVKDATGTFVANEPFTCTSGGSGFINTATLEDQKGFTFVVDGISSVPAPGTSITFTGDSISYVVQSTQGTYVDTTSEIVIVLSQEKASTSADNTVVTFREGYSSARLTGHDFLSIGTGGITTTNYPGTPTQPAAQGNEVLEVFPGRVYYVSTDQNGNFRVGEYFKIDQATGTATLNANAFNLAGLTELRLGSIGAQLGESINEFSSDGLLAGNSNLAVPTEAATKTYHDTNAFDIPFKNAISASEILGANKMRFSMDGLTLSGASTVYTIQSGGFHVVLGNSGFALFE
jgi:hypothetical protein